MVELRESSTDTGESATGLQGSMGARHRYGSVHEVATAGTIVFSAGAYLFDFVSNIVVLVEYLARYVELSSSLHDLEAAGGRGTASAASLQHQKSELAGYLFALLAILAFCHSLNALLFKIKASSRAGLGLEQSQLSPVSAAYFLPLIHLYRLANLVWRTLSCQGVRDLTCSLMNGLYCILGSALEGVPMLVLQFCGYLVLTRENVFGARMWATFKVSAAASLISAAYNGGASAQSVACSLENENENENENEGISNTGMKQKLLVAGTCAGTTLCATVARCLTFANVIVHVRERFSAGRSIRDQAKFHASDSIPLVFIASNIASYTALFCFCFCFSSASGKRPTILTRFLASLVLAYMSMMMGPLYAILCDAAEERILGHRRFHTRLAAVFSVHLSVDAAVLIATFRLGTLARPYVFISSSAIFGCIAFVFAFVRVDASRGRRNGGDNDSARREPTPMLTSRSTSMSMSLSPSISPSPSLSPSPKSRILAPTLTDPSEFTKPDHVVDYGRDDGVDDMHDFGDDRDGIVDGLRQRLPSPSSGAVVIAIPVRTTAHELPSASVDSADAEDVYP